MGVQFGHQRLMQLLQLIERQAGARLTIGAAAADGQPLAMLSIPRLYFANDLPTGTARTEHLTQKRPEREVQRIEALATVEPFRTLSQQGRRQPWTEPLTQLAQSLLTQLLGLRAELIKLGAALPAQKPVRNPRKKRCGLKHPKAYEPVQFVQFQTAI